MTLQSQDPIVGPLQRDVSAHERRLGELERALVDVLHRITCLERKHVPIEYIAEDDKK